MRAHVLCWFSHIWLFTALWADVLIAQLSYRKFKDKSCHLLWNLFVESSKLRYFLIPKGKSRHLWLILYISLFAEQEMSVFPHISQSRVILQNLMGSIFHLAFYRISVLFIFYIKCVSSSFTEQYVYSYMLQYINVSTQNIAHLKLNIIYQFFFIKKISKLCFLNLFAGHWWTVSM